MENKNILLLRHHPMGVKFTNPFYTHQTIQKLSDFVVIDVTSRVARDKVFMAAHPGFDKQLSPFFVGPVKASDGAEAGSLEVLWQFSKVYPCHDDNGKPNADYFKWRDKYFAMKSVPKDEMRHACKTIGYEHKDARYSAYYDKEKKEYVPLGYVESRKKVYFPEYAKLVVNSDAYKWLKSLVDEGKKIALVDFDAYNYYETGAKEKRYENYLTKCKKDGVLPRLKKEDFMKISTMKDLINSPYLSGGHACVLKALLQGDIEVKDGEVIDHVGLLD